MRISELAQRTGSLPETVRYYERIGLLRSPLRSPGGYRLYRAADVERLQFIVRSRALGFHLKEIRGLLRLASEPALSCQEVDLIARDHLALVEAKQRELAMLASELRKMIGACHKETRATCTVLKALSDAAA